MPRIRCILALAAASVAASTAFAAGEPVIGLVTKTETNPCLLYTSPSPRDS